MFALAYFDRRTRELWLARDRFGIKPLYVAECAGELIFASEPQALLAHPGMTCRPDRLAIASFLLRGRQEARLTFFEGIEAIEPGSWWCIRRSGSRAPSLLPRARRPRRGAPARRRSRPGGPPLRVPHRRERAASPRQRRAARRHLQRRRRLEPDRGLREPAPEGPALLRRGRRLRAGRGKIRAAGRRPPRRAPHARARGSRDAPAALARGDPDRGTSALQPQQRRPAPARPRLPGGRREGAAQRRGSRRAVRRLRARSSKPTARGAGAARLVLALDPIRSRRRRSFRRLRSRRFLAIRGWMRSGTWGSPSSTATASCAASRWRRSSRRCAPPPTAPSWSAASTISTSRSTRCCAATTGWRWPPRSRCAFPSSRTPSSISASICRCRAKFRRGQSKWVVKQAAAEAPPRRDRPRAQARLPDARRLRPRLRGAAGRRRRGRAAALDRPHAAGPDLPLARRREGLRFLLVGLELWGRIYLRGEKPDALASELLACSPVASSTSKQLPPPSRGR